MYAYATAWTAVLVGFQKRTIAESRVVPSSNYCEILLVDFHSPLPCPRHDNDTVARQQQSLTIIAVNSSSSFSSIVV